MIGAKREGRKNEVYIFAMKSYNLKPVCGIINKYYKLYSNQFKYKIKKYS